MAQQYWTTLPFGNGSTDDPLRRRISLLKLSLCVL